MNEILTGKQCPYCFEPTEYIDSKYVYSRSYGMIYICKPCNAWVGVHKDTNKALGRLANEELREAKKEAHKYFDQIAKTGLINKIWPTYLPNTSNRSKAYLWLSEQTGIPPDRCHIGMMDVEQCQKVVEVSRKALKKVKEQP
jgi:hypothetical protein